jgi:hypothetical protein
MYYDMPIKPFELRDKDKYREKERAVAEVSTLFPV